MAKYQPTRVLREGDTLTIPRGFKVEFTESRVSVFGPNSTAESRKGFGFGDFLLCCEKRENIK